MEQKSSATKNTWICPKIWTEVDITYCHMYNCAERLECKEFYNYYKDLPTEKKKMNKSLFIGIGIGIGLCVVGAILLILGAIGVF